MRLYLYIQLKEIANLSFQSPLTSFLNENTKNLILFDADQASDINHLATGIKFIEEAEKIVLHIEEDGTSHLGATARLFEKLRKSDKPIKTLYSGQEKQISNLLQMLGQDVKCTDFENEIRNFLG